MTLRWGAAAAMAGNRAECEEGSVAVSCLLFLVDSVDHFNKLKGNMSLHTGVKCLMTTRGKAADMVHY